MTATAYKTRRCHEFGAGQGTRGPPVETSYGSIEASAAMVQVQTDTGAVDPRGGPLLLSAIRRSHNDRVLGPVAMTAPARQQGPLAVQAGALLQTREFSARFDSCPNPKADLIQSTLGGARLPAVMF